MEATFLDELETTTDLQYVVTHLLFDAVPHLFAGDRQRWNRWKADLAVGLDVDPHSVMLVGSAAMGISLNPYKDFRAFSDRSDVDIAVVSTRHFDAAWHTLRSIGVRMLSLPRRTQLEIRQYAPSYVYWGVIATDKLLGVLDFGPRWEAAIEAMRQQEPTLDRDLKVRLCRDIASLRAYQLRGLRQARAKLDERGNR